MPVTVDAAHAGSGNLEIMVNDGTIPCSVQNRGNRQFHASFMPKEPSLGAWLYVSCVAIGIAAAGFAAFIGQALHDLFGFIVDGTFRLLRIKSSILFIKNIFDQ